MPELKFLQKSIRKNIQQQAGEAFSRLLLFMILRT
jgi:hypothetical protein